MPGLFGYIDQNDSSRDDLILQKMRDLSVYRKEYKSEGFFRKESVHAGYCAPCFERVDEHAAEESGVTCWFDGEIYNIGELSGGQSVKELMINAYKRDTLKDFLRGMDGYFSAVIYDSGRRRLKLLIDRFGFRHLFYTKYDKKFLWASECKAFLAAPDFKIDVNRQSVDEFMKFGILCEDRTWLNGVYLLAPATILTYDAETGSVQTERYWSPDEIHPITAKIDIREYYEEWGRLFKSSVAKRTDEKERIGLTLSGGLDSRAILAAMPFSGSKINAVTLGDSKCDDVRFAAAAAKLKGANHHFLPLKVDGWFERACLGIWATDGALNLSSQLGIEHLRAISNLLGVSLNGIGGGRMQGGRVVGTSAHYEFDGIKDGVPGLQMIRRRMLRPGFRLDESFFKVRMPFFDNDLYNFVTALPPDVKNNGFFYNNALLHNFADYYKKIPWQQAGVPISLPPFLFKAGSMYKRVLSRLKRKLRKIGLPVHDRKLYFNLSEVFCRNDANLGLMKQILSDKEAFYPQYMPEERIVMDPALGGAVIERICRILTFEIWMRQINKPDFRPETPQINPKHGFLTQNKVARPQNKGKDKENASQDC
jgi:asparagine synthase (glutamine-hydrolysing)